MMQFQLEQQWSQIGWMNLNLDKETSSLEHFPNYIRYSDGLIQYQQTIDEPSTAPATVL